MSPPVVVLSPGHAAEQTYTPLPTKWDDFEGEDQEGYQAILRLGLLGIAPLDEQQTRTMRQVVALTTFGAEDAEVRVQIVQAADSMYEHHTAVIEQEVAVLAETESHAGYIVAKLSKAVEYGLLTDALSFSGLAGIQILDSQVALAGMAAKDFPKAEQSIQVQSEPEKVFTFEVSDLLTSSQDAPGIVIIASVCGGVVIAFLVVGLFGLKMHRKGPRSASTATKDGAQPDSEDTKKSSDKFSLEPALPSEVELRSMPSHEIQEGIESPSTENLPRVAVPQKHALGSHHKRNGSAVCLLDFQGGFSSNESTPRHSRTHTMEDVPARDLTEIVLSVTGPSAAKPTEQQVGKIISHQGELALNDAGNFTPSLPYATLAQDPHDVCD